MAFGGDLAMGGGADLPAMPGGLSWDASNLYTSGSLTVMPEPATLSLLALGRLALLRRKSGYGG